MAAKLAFAGLLAPLASALSFPGATRGAGYVSVPVVARAPENVLRRRATDKTADIEMPEGTGNSGWIVNITIGTPGQMTQVSLDTGSTELWVDPDCSSAGFNTTSDGTPVQNDPLHDPTICAARGRYDPTKSSTQKQPDNLPGKVFTYGDSTSATINYYEDTINFGDITIQNQIFGVANASNQTGIGIMGMGPPPFGYNNTGFYPLILTTMANEGVINAPAFSIDLRDYDNTTGSLIFGGVDKGKFGGPLTKITMETVTQTIGGVSFPNYSYWLKVNSLTVISPNNTQKTTSVSIPGGSFIGGLDCGSSLMLMPNGIASDICSDLNGKSVSGAGCVVDCALRTQTGGLKVSLNGKDITIGYENLILQYGSGSSATCVLGMEDSPLTSTNPTTYLLGAPFLRAVYAVFDWTNGAVHLAQAANCGTNIVAIGSGTSGVPDGNGDCPTSLATSSKASVTLTVTAALLIGAMLW